jgi:hypothetical protein
MNSNYQQIYSSILEQLRTNPDLATSYAKPNHPTCLGRGYITLSIIHGNIEKRELCSCVYKNIKKEIQEMLKEDTKIVSELTG